MDTSEKRTRRHAETIKTEALALIHMGLPLREVSKRTKVPVRTLENWRNKQYEMPLPTLMEHWTALAWMRHHLLNQAIALTHAIQAGIADAPLSQQTTALNQLISIVNKLTGLLPDDEATEETIYRIEYEDSRRGAVDSTAPGPDDHLAE